jgi:hypothetical protein
VDGDFIADRVCRPCLKGNHGEEDEVSYSLAMHTPSQSDDDGFRGGNRTWQSAADEGGFEATHSKLGFGITAWWYDWDASADTWRVRHMTVFSHAPGRPLAPTSPPLFLPQPLERRSHDG